MDVWFCFRAGTNGREATRCVTVASRTIRSMRALLSAPRDTCAFLLTLTYIDVGNSEVIRDAAVQKQPQILRLVDRSAINSAQDDNVWGTESVLDLGMVRS